MHLYNRTSPAQCTATFHCWVGEQIQASDAAGARTLDAVTSISSRPVLTDLKLTGNVLSWRRAGAPHSVTLRP